MANKRLFQSQRWSEPKADTFNEAGGRAFNLTPEQALAQYVCTGCLNNTYYVSGGEQLDQVKALINKVSDEFAAAVAVYGRQKAGMKDMPALVLALLASKKTNKATALFNRAFPRIVDNGKMLRTFIQIVRSGQTGRKSFGTTVKRAINDFLTGRKPEQLFRDTVGESPSLGDIVKMTHPRFEDSMLNEIVKRELGRQYNKRKLPKLVRDYEKFIEALSEGEGKDLTPPDVDFRLLTGCPLSTKQWKQIAMDACERKRVQMVIGNLNTFVRHNALDDEVARAIREMLEDEDAIVGTPSRPSRLFPYKIWTAYHFAKDVPTKVKMGLARALDLSLSNLPEFDGQIVVAPDISGSMSSPVTGNRGTATTKVQCRHMAALVSCVFLKKNPDNTVIMPFADRLFLEVGKLFDPLDTVATNVERINRLPGGGTDVSLPLVEINRRGMQPDLVVYLSDMQSWIETASGRDRYSGWGWGGGTTVAKKEWEALKRRNKRAKAVWINLQPSGTVQVPNRPDALNIGGFSDSVFQAMSSFMRAKDANSWVKEIKAFWE